MGRTIKSSFHAASSSATRLEVGCEALIVALAQSGPSETSYFDERSRLGLGVGLDADGNLVYADDLIGR